MQADVSLAEPPWITGTVQPGRDGDHTTGPHIARDAVKPPGVGAHRLAGRVVIPQRSPHPSAGGSSPARSPLSRSPLRSATGTGGPRGAGTLRASAGAIVVQSVRSTRASIVSGRANRYPCTRSHASARSVSRCASVSTPSAVTVQPMA